MKLNTPLVTLLAGLVLGVGVLVTSAVWGSGSSSAATPAGNPYAATSSAPAATTAAPAQSSPATAPTTAAPTSPAPATAATTAPAQATAPAAASSGTNAYPPKADYVGKVNGGGAAVAISVHGTKAVAYLCNGGAVASWLRGSVSAGKLNLTGKNGARLSLDYRKSDATGFLMTDGTKYTFSAPLVHRVPSLHRQPGLYEATATVHGVMIKAGWIVLQDGSQIGSVEYDPGSAIPPTAEAPVLDLATGTAQYDGVTLVASLISGLSGSGF